MQNSSSVAAMVLISRPTSVSERIGLLRVEVAAMATFATLVCPFHSAQFIFRVSFLTKTQVFKNFYIENITSSPVLIQQCTHWAGYNVPACADTPATGYFSNISWSNFTGYMNEKVGTKSISWACSPLAKCEGFSFKDIDIKSANGANGTYTCSNIEGYDSTCQKD